MKRCKRCDVYVKDDTQLCPLCNSVLEGSEQGVNTYPELAYELHRFIFLKRIFYFVLLVIGTLSVIVNYFTFSGMYWSVIVLVGIAYCVFTVSYTVMHRTNLGGKVIAQAVGILILTFIIDMVTGYKGWSLRYAIPALLALANIALLVLMTLQRDRWQGYFMCMIAVFILSLVSVAIAAFGLIDNMFLAVMVCAVIGLTVAGVIIFGGRRARYELKRRFHI